MLMLIAQFITMMEIELVITFALTFIRPSVAIVAAASIK